MAFTAESLMRVSTGMNYDTTVTATTGVVAARTNGVIYWSYKTADTMAQVLNPAYFLPAMIAGGTAASQLRLMAPGDKISITCASDAAVVANGGNFVTFDIEILTVTIPVINSPPAANVNPSITYRPVGLVTEYAVVPTANIIAGTAVQVTSTPYFATGVGYKIIPDTMALTLSYNTTTYAGAATHTITYGADTTSIMGTISAGFVNSASNTTFFAVATANAITDLLRAGQPLMWKSSDVSTVGNSNILVRTHYSLTVSP